MRVVYSPNYNIEFMGLERLHPFDSKKYGRAWKIIADQLGDETMGILASPEQPVSQETLLRIHTPRYLERLKEAKHLAKALELPILANVPASLTDHHVLNPMRWATAGSVLGARLAMANGIVINLGGGYHHAKPEGGEGFCVYSDIGLAVDGLRRNGLLSDSDEIAYIDLDAHQGNGVSHVFLNDRRLRSFDIYNEEIYPANDRVARNRIDCDLPIPSGISDSDYLRLLRAALPPFLKSFNYGRPAFAIFGAGTDVLAGDPLGAQQLSPTGILERDLFVVEQLRQLGVPTLMLTSGGYTDMSHQLIAHTVVALVRKYLD